MIGNEQQFMTQLQNLTSQFALGNVLAGADQAQHLALFVTLDDLAAQLHPAAGTLGVAQPIVAQQLFLLAAVELAERALQGLAVFLVELPRVAVIGLGQG